MTMITTRCMLPVFFIIMCIALPAGQVQGAATESTVKSTSQALDSAFAAEVTCAVSGKQPYLLSTFPSDTLLLALFQSVYPVLKGYKLNVMGKTQNTASGVYSWHFYYLDSTNAFQHCWIELAMTKNTNTKYPYYWLYTLSIPTGSVVSTCSGVLEQKYQY